MQSTTLTRLVWPALGALLVGSGLTAIARGSTEGGAGGLLRWVLSGGGYEASSGGSGNGLRGTVGQPVVGSATAPDGSGIDAGFWPQGSITVGVPGETSGAPAVTRLHQSRPNPARERTTIAFELADAGRVSIRVFDVSGRRVETLVDTELPAGSHHVPFAPEHLPSGIYFYELRHEDTRVVKSLTLVR